MKIKVKMLCASALVVCSWTGVASANEQIFLNHRNFAEVRSDNTASVVDAQSADLASMAGGNLAEFPGLEPGSLNLRSTQRFRNDAVATTTAVVDNIDNNANIRSTAFANNLNVDTPHGSHITIDALQSTWIDPSATSLATATNVRGSVGLTARANSNMFGVSAPESTGVNIDLYQFNRADNRAVANLTAIDIGRDVFTSSTAIANNAAIGLGGGMNDIDVAQRNRSAVAAVTVLNARDVDGNVESISRAIGNVFTYSGRAD